MPKTVWYQQHPGHSDVFSRPWTCSCFADQQTAWFGADLASQIKDSALFGHGDVSVVIPLGLLPLVVAAVARCEVLLVLYVDVADRSDRHPFAII